VLAKKPHQRARREIRHARNRFNPEALGEMRFDVGHGPAEGCLGLTGRSPKFAFIGVREPGGDEREQF